jgi:hypothetical protein
VDWDGLHLSLVKLILKSTLLIESDGGTLRGHRRPTRPGDPSTQRVLAWWDLDLQIGQFHKRKLTARPLRELERMLGHRLHIEDRAYCEYLPGGVWKVMAYHYIDTPDPALATYSMFMKLSPLAESFGLSWQGFNSKAHASNGNDESTICAFYWNPPDQVGMPRYRSGGVLLSLQDLTSKPYSPADRRNRLARPVVRVLTAPQAGADYRVDFTVHITCGNKQKLMTYHWPRFLASHWPDGVQHVEVDSRAQGGKPNIIHVRQTLKGVREHEAMTYCLAFAPSFEIKIIRDLEFRFSGNRQPSQDGRDGIVAFELTRTSG